MSFDEKITTLVDRANQQRAHLLTEEAMKTAIILPMLQALEFDIFDPTEVIPEFTADVGIKRGEKVDYAIKIGGAIAILLECKSPNQDLDPKHMSQLFRYFSVTDARFAVLTNGFEWEFYTDLDAPNRMDKHPFLAFSLVNMDRASTNELGKFRKSTFDVDSILSTATELKYVSALKGILKQEFDNPSPELVSLIGRQVYSGVFTARVAEQFQIRVKRSLSEVIRDRVNARLSSALQHNFDDPPVDEDEQVEEIETTEEEWDGYRVAVAIASQIIDPSRIAIRDQRSYCGVLVDDNNRKPLVRLWFNSPTTRYLGLFDGETEERVSVKTPTDLYKFADRIRATASKYA